MKTFLSLQGLRETDFSLQVRHDTHFCLPALQVLHEADISLVALQVSNETDFCLPALSRSDRHMYMSCNEISRLIYPEIFASLINISLGPRILCPHLNDLVNVKTGLFVTQILLFCRS